jgi:hypothetical protein
VGDDVIHRGVLLSASLPEAMRDLFTFLKPDINLQLMDLGTVPWWTLETVRASFLRPLTVISLWLDYQLWPNSGFLMHLHNSLWYAAVCILATMLYRRFIGKLWAAGLAAFLFTVDLAHLNSVASLAARNILLTVFFGMLTLLAHDRWRREGWRPGAFLAPLWLTLALLSAEAGVGTTAFLGAYAIFMDQGDLRKRIASLIPCAATVIIWRLIYQRLGYGAWGSGFYVDPGREPLQFAQLVFERGPLLLLGQWSGLDPALLVPFSTSTSRFVWAGAVLFVTVIGAALVPLLRRYRVARFWGLGMLFAVVPSCAVNVPSGRLLTFVGLGSMGLMAQFVTSLLDGSEWLPIRRAWRVGAWILCFAMIGLHAALSPLLIPFALVVQDPVFRALTDIGSPSNISRKDVVIVNAPSPGHSIYIASAKSTQGLPTPAHLRMLAPGYCTVLVTRVDDHTLLVRPHGGYLPPPGQRFADGEGSPPVIHVAYAYQQGDQFFRSSNYPMELGQRVELTGATAEVTALTPDGRPAEARIEFDVPLEAQSLEWLQWDWEREVYVPFQLPDVGETVRIPGPSEGLPVDWASLRSELLSWTE